MFGVSILMIAGCAMRFRIFCSDETYLVVQIQIDDFQLFSKLFCAQMTTWTVEARVIVIASTSSTLMAYDVTVPYAIYTRHNRCHVDFGLIFGKNLFDDT